MTPLPGSAAAAQSRRRGATPHGSVTSDRRRSSVLLPTAGGVEIVSRSRRADRPSRTAGPPTCARSRRLSWPGSGPGGLDRRLRQPSRPAISVFDRPWPPAAAPPAPARSARSAPWARGSSPPEEHPRNGRATGASCSARPPRPRCAPTGSRSADRRAARPSAGTRCTRLHAENAYRPGRTWSGSTPRSPRHRTDAPRRLHPVHARHPHVHQDHVHGDRPQVSTAAAPLPASATTSISGWAARTIRKPVRSNA